MSGSLSATASNALLLDGTGSVGFTTTASFTAVSSSQQQISSSLLTISRSYATTGSNTFTGVQNFSNTCNPIGFNSVASLYTAGGLQVTYDSYFSSSVFVNGNLTVFGTQSVVHVSSSQFNIGTNIITVNTATPSIRYGGLSVYDSGSTGLSGSIFWDSEANHWVYANASGSGGGATYAGGMFISGPRSSGLGCEQGTTSCMLLVGQGGDHLTSSMIYHSSTCTNFYSNALFVSSSGNVGIGVTAPTYNLQVLNTIGLRANSSNFQAIKGTGFGYSPSSYKVVMLGTSASAEFTTVSIAYDPAGNANGSFNGNGIEVLFRRGVQFVTPNSANNNYYLTNLVLQDGNVGIGTTNPVESLQVVGNIRTSNRYYINDGTNTLEIGSNYIQAYLNSGAATTNLLFYSGTAERMRITNCGNVLIGMTSSVSGRVSCIGLQAQNEVYSRGSSSGFFWEDRSINAWGGWYTNSGLTYMYNGSGNASSINMSSGAYTALSDVNKKKDFETSTIGLNEILQLKPTLYRFKDAEENSQKELGFIAQEVKNYIPQAYVESNGGMGGKFIGLNDRAILAVAVKAIQEQQCTINALKSCLGIA
jgi:hypothetical protein